MKLKDFIELVEIRTYNYGLNNLIIDIEKGKALYLNDETSKERISDELLNKDITKIIVHEDSSVTVSLRKLEGE